MKQMIAIVGLALLAACADGPCAMSKVEKSRWCDACETAATADKCGCGAATRETEVCVKEVVECTECDDVHAGPCAADASKKCCKATRDVAEVEGECAKCEEAVSPLSTCKCGGMTKKTCAKSGDWPHATKTDD